MRRTYDILPEFPRIQLTRQEIAALERAATILSQLRELAGDEDWTADLSLGRADAEVASVLRDLADGRGAWLDCQVTR